jgi:branched-chain amino acid transport system substrate-binding protein
MQHRRMLVTALAALTLTSLVAGGQAQNESVKIGAVTSLTGRFATFGKMQRAGFNVALREANARGGINGRKVELLLEDDASDTNKALAAGEKLVNSGVPLVIGAYASGITKPLGQYLTRVKVPLLVATAVDETITKPGSPYIFRVNNNSAVYSESFFALFRDLGVKTVALLTSNDAFGNSVFSDAVRMAASRGIKIVAQDKYDQGLTDFRPIINRFKSLNPDIVFLASYEADSVALARQIKEVGLAPKAIAGAATGFALPAFAKNAGEAAEGMLVSVIWSPDVQYPGAPQLYKALKDELGEEPSQHAAQSYAAMKVAVEAVKQAGGTDREKVREALGKVSISTGFGPVRFKTYSGYTNQNPTIGLVTQIQNGEAVAVYPSRIATGKITYPAKR